MDPKDLVPAYDLVDVQALKALQRGEATEGQQKRALDWIVKNAAATYDLSFHPGPDGARDTDFSEGRRFVGLQIVKLLNLSHDAMKRMRRDYGRDSTSPGHRGHVAGSDASAGSGTEQPGGERTTH